MDRSLFAQRFADAAVRTRDFARELIEEPLPDAMRFRVHLNSSHDANATDEFRLFPEDSSEERARALEDLDAESVVDVLWRDGYVPQWVDLAVVGESGEATMVEVVACGRFIDDERRLYYTWTDIAPFSPKGPTYPVDHVEGRRFSIYDRSSCWSNRELDHVHERAERVWSLELHGPAFGDEALLRGPTYDRLEVLELHRVPLRGPGLKGLARFPRLRHLRVHLAGVPELDLSGAALIPTLDSLALYALPPKLTSIATLVASAPNLRDLTLGAGSIVAANGTLAFAGLEKLTLRLPVSPAWLVLPKTLRGLELHAPSATDDDVTRTLSACPNTMVSLSLRGTPVSDVIFEALEDWPSLEYLDLVDTRITRAALEGFTARRPGLRHFPAFGSTPRAE